MFLLLERTFDFFLTCLKPQCLPGPARAFSFFNWPCVPTGRGGVLGHTRGDQGWVRRALHEMYGFIPHVFLGMGRSRTHKSCRDYIHYASDRATGMVVDNQRILRYKGNNAGKIKLMLRLRLNGPTEFQLTRCLSRARWCLGAYPGRSRLGQSLTWNVWFHPARVLGDRKQ